MTPTREEVERLRRELMEHAPVRGHRAVREEAATMLSTLRERLEAAEAAEAERDEADRRAGAAERQMEALRDSARRRADWLDKAKRERGYDTNVSFDVVWSETCAKADYARAQAVAGFEAGRDAAAELSTWHSDRLVADIRALTPPPDHAAALTARLDAEWDAAIEAAGNLQPGHRRWINRAAIRALRRNPKEGV